jgi:hypothetical protein
LAEGCINVKSTLNQRWRSILKYTILRHQEKKQVVQNSSSRFIYVVTIWQERPASSDAPAVWRVRVEDARTGDKYGFTDLKQLMAFLKAQRAETVSRQSEDKKEMFP